MKQNFVYLALLAALAGIPSGAPAEEADSSFRWRGFLTAGYVQNITGVTYLSYIGKNPNFTYDSKLGLNLAADITPHVRVAAQLLALGYRSGFQPAVDWAFAEYEPVDELQVRAGKIRFPMWLIAEHYNVGYSYLWARPPPEVYPYDLLSTFFGLSTTYRPGWAGGGLTFTLFGGQSPINIPAVLEVAGKTTELAIRGTFEKLVGLSIAYEGVSTRLRASWAVTDATLDVVGPLEIGTLVPGPAPIMYSVPIRQNQSAAFSFWAFGAELKPLSWLRVISEYTLSTTKSITTHGGYFSLGFPVGRWEPHVTYAGKVNSTNSLLHHRLAVGLNVSLAKNVLLKTEWEGLDAVKGTGFLAKTHRSVIHLIATNLNVIF